jgi:hypothetical protein
MSPHGFTTPKYNMGDFTAMRTSDLTFIFPDFIPLISEKPHISMTVERF